MLIVSYSASIDASYACTMLYIVPKGEDINMGGFVRYGIRVACPTAARCHYVYTCHVCPRQNVSCSLWRWSSLNRRVLSQTAFWPAAKNSSRVLQLALASINLAPIASFLLMIFGVIEWRMILNKRPQGNEFSNDLPICSHSYPVMHGLFWKASSIVSRLCPSTCHKTHESRGNFGQTDGSMEQQK
jgi:hypothetical protein